MGYDQRITLCACIKLYAPDTTALYDEVLYNDEYIDNLSMLNGKWGTPKDDTYYIGSNFSKPVTGISFNEGSGEGGVIITDDMRDMWLSNFKEKFSKEITILKNIYAGNCQVVVAFVNGGS